MDVESGDGDMGQDGFQRYRHDRIGDESGWMVGGPFCQWNHRPRGGVYFQHKHWNSQGLRVELWNVEMGQDGHKR